LTSKRESKGVEERWEELKEGVVQVGFFFLKMTTAKIKTGTHRSPERTCNAFTIRVRRKHDGGVWKRWRAHDAPKKNEGEEEKKRK